MNVCIYTYIVPPSPQRVRQAMKPTIDLDADDNHPDEEKFKSPELIAMLD